MSLSVRHNGQFREVTGLSVRHNGAWRTVQQLWVRSGGQWRSIPLVNDADYRPRSFSASASAFGILTWQHPIIGQPNNYEIQWANAGGWSSLTFLNGNSTSHTFDACFMGNNGDLLSFRIRAIHSNYTSDWVMATSELSGCGFGGF